MERERGSVQLGTNLTSIVISESGILRARMGFSSVLGFGHPWTVIVSS